MNSQINKDRNKFYLQNSPKRKEDQGDISLENSFTCLNTKFQKTGGRAMDLYPPK